MSKDTSEQIQALLITLACLTTVLFALVYFTVGSISLSQEIQDFVRGILGNIIATILSFLVTYLFLTKNGIRLGDDDVQSGIDALKVDTDLLKEAVTLQDMAGEVNKATNKNWLWNAFNEGLYKDTRKIKKDLELNTEILKAIRDESKDSDRIRERIKINLERETLMSERDLLREERDKIRQQLQQTRSELREKTSEAMRKDIEITRKDAEISEKRQEIRSKERKIDEKDDRIADFSRQLSALRNELKQDIVGLRSTVTTYTSDMASAVGSLNFNQKFILADKSSSVLNKLEQVESASSRIVDILEDLNSEAE